MKKRFIIFGIFLLLLITIFSQTNLVNAESKELRNLTENERVNLAYSCLNSQIEKKGCDDLSVQEKIFSVLTLGECVDELLDSSKNEECWPSSRCDIKTTAQAVLALSRVGEDVDDAIDWLKENTVTPRDLEWYLEVESKNVTTCKVYYEDQMYGFSTRDDRSISQKSDLGDCLKVSNSGYWLQILPECYNLEFKISCDKNFLTTLLFKKQDEVKIHVLDETHTSVSGGATLEKINSRCFSTNGEGSDCDYEGSLWATMVLTKLGESENQAYLPYLISEESRNQEYFPYPFLYSLTLYSDYEQRIFDLQINDKYWEVANDKYFDTALALLPFPSIPKEELVEKENAINWLFDVQDDSGCWGGNNTVSTAFLLYSLWPRSYVKPIGDDPIGNGTTSDNDCIQSGYFCITNTECSRNSGNVLGEFSFSCPGVQICCDTKPAESQSCVTDLDGNICTQNQYCTGTKKSLGMSDVSGTNFCCVGGTCKEKEPEPTPTGDCPGSCELFSCEDGYTLSTNYTCQDDKKCCVKSTEDKNGMGWWIWLLFGIIILIVIGIIYRDKIKEAIEKMNKGKSGDNLGDISQRRGPGSPGNFQRPREIPPRTQMRPGIGSGFAQRSNNFQNQFPKPRPKSPKELDDVLRKLKDMGN